MPKIILVSNRLPIRLDESGTPIRTTGGLASALEAVESDAEKVWVGWNGDPLEEVQDPEALSNKLRDLAIEPVYLTEAEVNGFYEGYSNSTLWPLLHSMSQRAHFDHASADSYRTANEKFAEAVLRVAEDDDIVWIHDYQLFLLPGLLRSRRPKLRIGFFLHTPFPSSDIFRILPERREILLGILGADLIGFHTFNYLRHFRSSLLRVLGLETGNDTFFHKGLRHKLGVYPIGHNHQGFADAMKTEAFTNASRQLNEDLRSKKLVLNVERLDYTKGVPQKLAAIRHFLENNPELRDSVMFLIIAVPSRQNVEEYAELTEEVQREVGAINGDFGGVGNSPVHFLHRGFPPEELASFYARADVCLVTPLVDGMNLVAKEFIDCKREHAGASPGVLVLSEFAGAAAEMSHAWMVNPYDIADVSQAIRKSLDLSDEDRWERIHMMQKHLEKNDAGAWAARFLSYFDGEVDDSADASKAGLEEVKQSIIQSAKAGKRVSLFLDYDGTLRDFTKRPEDAIPDPALIPLLESLAEKVDVALVSGRPMHFLSEHFSGKGFALVSEHGYRWSRPDNLEWELINPLVDISWKELIMPQLEQAAQLTPGSHIEEKPSAVVWHYRATDPEFGLWQATRLLSELTDLTANLPVTVHHGKKIIEIASQQVSKGAAVEALALHYGTEVGLSAGDDQTDETMFTIDTHMDPYHTIHLGTTDTAATHITGFERFRSFLEELAKALHS
ncbi:MAG: bifunctional alpha,alpha-trehalose-phosphate synthase (UDP-forming)/trehalose-phosphatase [Verrucomicrobiaceae bacterium]